MASARSLRAERENSVRNAKRTKPAPKSPPGQGILTALPAACHAESECPTSTSIKDRGIGRLVAVLAVYLCVGSREASQAVRRPASHNPAFVEMVSSN